VKLRGRPLRRGARVLTGLLAGAVVAAACGGGTSNPTLPPEAKGRPTVYVALGGDDNGAGRRGIAAAWPQVLFRTAFPRTAVFVNLSSPRAGAETMLDTQVGSAVALHPDVVTITVIDDAEHDTSPAVVEQDLTAAIGRLRAGRSPRVLVGTIPNSAAPAPVTQPLDQAIAAAARASGATLVDLGTADGPNDEAMGTQIARSFARALHAR